MSRNSETNREIRRPFGPAAGSVHQESSRQPTARLSCAPADRECLEQWSRAATAAHRLVLRSRIILLLLDGHSQVSTARTLRISRETVCRWERRFSAGGVEALRRDQPGRGRRPGRNADHVARVTEAIAASPAGTWTIRRLAAHLGISPATVQRIRREHMATQAESLAAQIVNRAGAETVVDAGKALALPPAHMVVPEARATTPRVSLLSLALHAPRTPDSSR